MDGPRKKLCINALSAKAGGNLTYATNVFCKSDLADYVDGQLFVPPGFLEQLGDDSAIPTKTISKLDELFPIRRFIWEQTEWRKIVASTGCDILYSSANYGLVRRLPGVRQLLMVQGEISFMPTYQSRILPLLSRSEKLEYTLRRQLVLATARASDTIFFPSQTALDAVVGRSPKLKARSAVNYLGCRNDLFNTSRRSWKSDGTLRLLYLSVYYPHKDPVTLVKAIEALNDKGFPATAHITMDRDQFRFWSHGPSDLKAIEPAIERGLVTLGGISYLDLPTRLSDFDAVCIPSLAETFGFSLIEGLAAGMPVIASDIPIHREIGGDLPCFFEAGSAHSLANRIRAVDQSPEQREQLARLGPKWVQDRYSWSAHTDRLKEALV